MGTHYTHRAGMQQQQTVRLVCAAHGMEVVTPRCGRGYGIKQLSADIKVGGLWCTVCMHNE